MLNSKQRAKLRGIANSYDTLLQIGKGGIDDATVKQVRDMIAARELIKLRVLESSGYTARDAADELAKATQSEVVQVIGSKFILFKRKPKESSFDL